MEIKLEATRVRVGMRTGRMCSFTVKEVFWLRFPEDCSL